MAIIGFYLVMLGFLSMGLWMLGVAASERIPEELLAERPFNRFEKEPEINTRLAFFFFGSAAVGMALYGTYDTTRDMSGIVETLWHPWQGIQANYVLGAIIMLLGGGLLRAAFIKQLPKTLIALLLHTLHRRKKYTEIAERVARLLLFGGGIFLCEIGATLYYLKIQ